MYNNNTVAKVSFHQNYSRRKRRWYKAGSVIASESPRYKWKDRGLTPYLVACAAVLFIVLPVFLIFWSRYYSLSALKSRKHHIRATAKMARSAVDPVCAGFRNGIIDSAQAVNRIIDLVRTLQYHDEDGSNYVFLGNFDGTMYVHPSRPHREFANEIEYRDKEGNRVVRDVIEITRNAPREGFYSYYFTHPEILAERLKVSYVIGIPELSLFLGTGMYAQRMVDHQQGMLAIAAVASQILGLLLAVPLWLANRRFRGFIRQHRQVFDNAGSAIVILDGNGLFIYANRIARCFMGLDESRLPDFQDMSRTAQVAFPALFSRIADPAARAQFHTEPITEKMHPAHPAVRLTWMIHPQYDNDGTTDRILCIGTDVSEKLRVEEQLRRSEARYRALVETSPDPILICRADGTFVNANIQTARSFGVKTVEEFLRARPRLADCLHPDDVEQAIRVLSGTPEDHSGISHDYRFIRNDGSIVVYEVHTRKLESLSDGPLFMSIARDITERKRAERALRESEERLRAFFDQAEEVISIIDHEGRVVEWNLAAERLAGMPRGSVLGRFYWDVLFELLPSSQRTQQQAESLKDKIQTALISGVPTFAGPHIARSQRTDGTEVIVIERSFPIRTEKGFWFGTISQDITEIEQARRERELTASRNQTLLQLNQMNDATRDEIVGFALEECVKLTRSEFGYVAFVDERRGTMTMHAWSETADRMCMVAQRRTLYSITDAGLWGEPVRRRVPVITNDYHAPDTPRRGLPSGHIPLDRHLGVPVFSGERIVLVMGVGNKKTAYENADVVQIQLLMEGVWRILERKETLDALVAGEERFRNMAESIEELFLLVDTRTRALLYAGPAAERIVGCTSSHLIENPEVIYTLIHPEDRERLRRNQVQSALAPTDEEFRLNHPDGTLRWLRMRSFPVRNADKTVYRVAGVISDITSVKMAQQDALARQQQLIKADKLASLGLLVSGTAHEINNPNNIIMLSADLAGTLLKKLAAADHEEMKPAFDRIAPKFLTCCDNIMNGSRRIEAIVKNLKDFARLESSVEHSLIDVRAVIDAACMITGPAIKKATRRFTLRIAEGLPAIRGNAQKIEQVLVNLLINACQALQSPDKSISLSAECDPTHSRLEITVEDQGCGIREDDLPHIFDPFFTTKRDHGGTGLGLSVSYSIVREHGGEIVARSGPGEGATMTVRLPIPGAQGDSNA